MTIYYKPTANATPETYAEHLAALANIAKRHDKISTFPALCLVGDGVTHRVFCEACTHDEGTLELSRIIEAETRKLTHAINTGIAHFLHLPTLTPLAGNSTGAIEATYSDYANIPRVEVIRLNTRKCKKALLESGDIKDGFFLSVSMPTDEELEEVYNDCMRYIKKHKPTYRTATSATDAQLPTLEAFQQGIKALHGALNLFMAGIIHTYHAVFSLLECGTSEFVYPEHALLMPHVRASTERHIKALAHDTNADILGVHLEKLWELYDTEGALA